MLFELMAGAARTIRRPRRCRSLKPAEVKLPASRELASAAQSSARHHESRLAKVGGGISSMQLVSGAEVGSSIHAFRMFR